MVMATQNPIEQEGTYPLPEAQLDRFMLHVKIDFPSPEAEREVLEDRARRSHGANRQVILPRLAARNLRRQTGSA